MRRRRNSPLASSWAMSAVIASPTSASQVASRSAHEAPRSRRLVHSATSVSTWTNAWCSASRSRSRSSAFTDPNRARSVGIAEAATRSANDRGSRSSRSVAIAEGSASRRSRDRRADRAAHAATCGWRRNAAPWEAVGSRKSEAKASIDRPGADAAIGSPSATCSESPADRAARAAPSANDGSARPTVIDAAERPGLHRSIASSIAAAASSKDATGMTRDSGIGEARPIQRSAMTAPCASKSSRQDSGAAISTVESIRLRIVRCHPLHSRTPAVTTRSGRIGPCSAAARRAMSGSLNPHDSRRAATFRSSSTIAAHRGASASETASRICAGSSPSPRSSAIALAKRDAMAHASSGFGVRDEPSRDARNDSVAAVSSVAQAERTSRSVADGSAPLRSDTTSPRRPGVITIGGISGRPDDSARS